MWSDQGLIVILVVGLVAGWLAGKVVSPSSSNAAPASPSRGPGNGILRAETGGLFQAQNAGEQSEFGSQTTLRLTPSWPKPRWRVAFRAVSASSA